MGTGRRKFAQNAALVLQSGQEGSPRPLQPYFQGDEKQIEGRGKFRILGELHTGKKLSVIYHTVELLSTTRFRTSLKDAIAALSTTTSGFRKVHVAKRELSEESVEKLLTVVRAGQLQRGKTQARKGKAPLKGKLKKWCCVPGCRPDSAGCWSPSPQQKLHNVAKDSREYQRLVRMVKRYKGLDEREDNVIPPPPAICRVEVPETGWQSNRTATATAMTGPSSPKKRKLADEEDPEEDPTRDAENPASDTENPAGDAENPASCAENPAGDAEILSSDAARKNTTAQKSQTKTRITLQPRTLN
ncbi:hypothetical protein OS493_017397 [Desmophyllum pertusum]|uniref:Uncharacterized protein n=1 Tax=Desmophyllum pertusum TaxID=174260 RepID=A0A9X0A262_9CNID|nr:hypothetical protein OS493_017397 [Desmophyllum pertusum]